MIFCVRFVLFSECSSPYFCNVWYVSWVLQLFGDCFSLWVEIFIMENITQRKSISALALNLMSKVAQLFRTPSLFLIFNAERYKTRNRLSKEVENLKLQIEIFALETNKQTDKQKKKGQQSFQIPPTAEGSNDG